jgi:hypothetical protein
MGKKKFTRTNEIDFLLNCQSVGISEGAGNCLFFEIGDVCTTDICEAVALMIRNSVTDPSVWNRDITKYLDIDHIDSKKCLYWLSGGDDEWQKRTFYKRAWNECDLLFQEEFGITVLVIYKKSKTLSDIKNGFIKFLNLPVFYEFSLSRNLI